MMSQMGVKSEARDHVNVGAPSLSEWLGNDPCWERVIMVIVIGAALGAGCASLVGVLIVLPQDAKAAPVVGIGWGMVFGIPLGALLAPAMWPLLRNAPVRSVVRHTSIGTVAGSLLGFAVTLPLQHIRELDGIVSFGLLSGAIAGLITASVRLWAHHRHSTSGAAGVAYLVPAACCTLILAAVPGPSLSLNWWGVIALVCINAALMFDSFRGRPFLARWKTFAVSAVVAVTIVLLIARGIMIDRALSAAMR
jgi:hypothetical protein